VKGKEIQAVLGRQNGKEKSMYMEFYFAQWTPAAASPACTAVISHPCPPITSFSSAAASSSVSTTPAHQDSAYKSESWNPHGTHPKHPGSRALRE
jgi:hypothetical protein